MPWWCLCSSFGSSYPAGGFNSVIPTHSVSLHQKDQTVGNKPCCTPVLNRDSNFYMQILQTVEHFKLSNCHFKINTVHQYRLHNCLIQLHSYYKVFWRIVELNGLTYSMSKSKYKDNINLSFGFNGNHMVCNLYCICVVFFSCTAPPLHTCTVDSLITHKAVSD